MAGVIFLGGLRPVSKGAVESALAVNREAFGVARTVASAFREKGGLFLTIQDTGGDFGLTGREADRAWLAGLSGQTRFTRTGTHPGAAPARPAAAITLHRRARRARRAIRRAHARTRRAVGVSSVTVTAARTRGAGRAEQLRLRPGALRIELA